jgi:DMSO/TMAO reductase YedYZ molybdopterin-dependent catalytic subunit
MALASRLAATAAVAPLARPASLFAQTPAADAWGKDALTRLSLRPPDYETPVALLDSFITPNEHFYVRSHLPVPPSLDAAAWRLQVEGEVDSAASLSVADLRALPPTTVTVTLECAGNGRAFFSPAVAGIQWKKGAVGTARWTGARLADILKRAGVKEQARFVHMQGADKPLGTMPAFVRQVPMDKAMHPDTVIAYEMNGQPIRRARLPLRAIVPGWGGRVRHEVLTTLRVAEQPSDSFWVATGYRYPVKRVAPGAAVDARTPRRSPGW